MKKYLAHIATFALFSSIFFVGVGLPSLVHAQQAAPPPRAISAAATTLGSGGGWFNNYLLQPIASSALKFTSLISYVTGLGLDKAVDFTVVNMASNISGLSSLNSIWGTIRDLANMCFIFVLLFTAIQTMFGKGDYK